MNKLIIDNQEYEIAQWAELPNSDPTPIIHLNGKIYYGKAIVKTPKEFEILSFVYSDDTGKQTITPCKACTHANLWSGRNFYPQSFEWMLEHATIDSFVRIKDSQIFTTGDICDSSDVYPGYPAKPIKKIFFNQDNVLYVQFDDGGCVPASEVQHHVYVVKTEDVGVVSKPDTVVFGCCYDSNGRYGKSTFTVERTKLNAKDWVYFVSEANRDRYIMDRTKSLSYNDVMEIVRTIKFNNAEENKSYLRRELSKKVEEKLKK